MKLPADIREFFRKQGAVGGKTRAQKLSAEERRDAARKAVQARWAKAKESSRNELKEISKKPKKNSSRKSSRRTGGSK
jgi:hypothetical protein